MTGGWPIRTAASVVAALALAGTTQSARAEPAVAPLSVDAPDWVNVTPSPVADPSPSYREGDAIAFDDTRGRAVLFGGLGSPYLADTWEWDGSIWIERTVTPGPVGRAQHAMAHDSARGRVVLFGGYGPPGFLADTWEWDGTRWIERTSTSRPPARYQHAMAYDRARGRVVLFGGNDGTHFFADTWEWDGNVWVERFSPTSPSARAGHGMAYDAARGRVVLFQGFSQGAYPGTPERGTWEWDGNVWINRTPAGGSFPDVINAYAMAYDRTSERVLLFGGLKGSSPGFGSQTWT